MDVRALGYVGVDARDLSDWTAYAEALGAMVVPSEHEDQLFVRIDDRPHRVIIRRSETSPGLAFAGWEFADEHALACAASELETAGFAVRHSSAEDRALRRVSGLVSTTDPSGFTLELFWGPIIDHVPFNPPHGGSGFVTGDLGFGHIVLGSPDAGPTADFYTNVLGFRVSDYWRPDGIEIVFLRCNQRHHSLALVPTPEPEMHHFMFEARALDDVGFALDRVRALEATITMDLGKHPNDEMVSFYSRNPSGSQVELGWGGRLVDDATWTVTEISKPSLWGHRGPV